MAAQRNRIRPTTWIALALIVLLAASGAIARFYTDALWFGELGQQGVFWRTIGWKWVTGAAFAVAFFAIVYTSLRVAVSMTPRAVPRIVEGPGPGFRTVVERARGVIGRASRAVVWVVSVGGALAAGASAVPLWQTLALALNGGHFGVVDPQFGRDVGFYVFTLPLLEIVRSWLTATLVFTLVVSAIAYLLTGAIRPEDRWRGVDPHVKGHLSVLGGLIVLVQAFGYWLDIFRLNYSPRGQVIGASYTDVHAQLPALQILIAIAVLSGIALIVNIRVRGWRLPVIALGVWIVAGILVGGVYPELVQQFRVNPNEAELEVPYIARNITATREAFGLDAVEVRAFAATEDLTADAVAGNEDTLANVRLWDPHVTEESFRQLQGIRPYYDFADVDIDRYRIGGAERQVLVSAREMDVNRLATTAQTWVNQHLVYTHGYGLVVSPVNEATTQGYPRFIVKDIPPSGEPGLEIEQPAIYFGETQTNYVIAATDLAEFHYPVGDENAETRYTGTGGVAMGGPIRRAAFALRFSAPQIVLSSYIRADSRVLYRRSIEDRLDALAPWLSIDGDPYPAIVDGQVIWMADGYTHSDRYPYAERYGSLNYVRNSVKVTIDAYDGTTTLYAYDPEDPLLAAWRSIFPGLVRDAAEIPEGVAAHIRYPEDLFRMQAEVYKTYHMRDPKVFYNKEDQWALPGETAATGTTMDPFYVLMRLPGEADESFMLMVPFTPRTKDNMIGWMAAKSDPAEYGKRIVYTFPKQRLVLGPAQVSARINQDPVISQQLTLWNQRGSGVRFGNLLVIPLEQSVVYIQPLYLQAEETAMPQLTRVIVAYADTVVMEKDLPSALLAIFGEGGSEQDGGAGSVDLARARELYDQAIEAQRSGDWAAYGERIRELGAVLDALGETSGEATRTP